MTHGYAVVRDVPASWSAYLQGEQAEAQAPAGLLLRAAGPTDEGFRVIDIWESRADWKRFRDRPPAGPKSKMATRSSFSPAIFASTPIRLPSSMMTLPVR